MIQKPNLILIGGSRRDVGKTLFACMLIERETRLRDVIGVKITVIDGGRGPGLSPGISFRDTRPSPANSGEWRAEGSSLDPDDAHPSGQAEIESYRIIDGPFRIIEESTPTDETDTGRMLEAGARRVYWLKVKRGHLREGIESLMKLIPDDACAVAEGTSARAVLEPGVFIVIQTKNEASMKDSCAAVLPLADRVATRSGREWDISPRDCLFIENEWMLRPRAGVLILAGGDSRRMGRDKALLPVHGQPMIASISEQLKPLFEEIVVSAERPDAYAFLGLPVAADAEPGQGPLMGIASGLPRMTHDVNFVTACDIPRINLSFVNRLIKLVAGFDIVLPYYDEGQYEPLFAVYRKTVVPKAAQILTAGGRSILDLLNRVKVNLIKMPDRNLIRNINTEEDYAEFIGRAFS
jgi:molybdenum cofactor guanylyltransferase